MLDIIRRNQSLKLIKEDIEKLNNKLNRKETVVELQSSILYICEDLVVHIENIYEELNKKKTLI